MKRRNLICTILFALLLCTTGCQFETPNSETTLEPDEPRLVVLYIPCTLRNDVLAPYNSSVKYTPELAKFAKESVVFTRHQSEAGLSGIAYASIFSGAQADVHGVYIHPGPIDDSVQTITETFSDAGYESYYFVNQRMADVALGQQGLIADRIYRDPYEKELETLNTVLDRVKSDPSYKAFVVLAFTQTHGPYERETFNRFIQEFPEESRVARSLKPQELEEIYRIYEENYFELRYNFTKTAARLELTGDKLDRFAAVLETYYKSNAHKLDERFGLVWDAITDRRLGNETLFALTVDHGEVLYREGTPFKWSHGLALAPEVTTVAWMIRAPGQGVIPQRYENVTRSIDVYPTLAGLAELPIPPTVQGLDLSAAITGHAEPPAPIAFSHTALATDPTLAKTKQLDELMALHPRSDCNLMWVMARKADLVVKIRNVGDEVFEPAAYDRAQDPFDMHDIFDPEIPDHRALYDALVEYKAHLVADCMIRRSVDSGMTPEEQIEALRSLGYAQ